MDFKKHITENEELKFKSGITMDDSIYESSCSDSESEEENSVGLHLDFLERIEQDLEQNPLTSF